MHTLALSGCDDAVQPVQAAGVAARQNPPAMAQGSRPPAVPAPEARPVTDEPGEARRLFDEVKRLNAACVAAGGRVSGSPECDLATVREEDLAGLGYCIDYPNDETLTTCRNRGATARKLEIQETWR